MQRFGLLMELKRIGGGFCGFVVVFKSSLKASCKLQYLVKLAFSSPTQLPHCAVMRLVISPQRRAGEIGHFSALKPDKTIGQECRKNQPVRNIVNLSGKPLGIPFRD